MLINTGKVLVQRELSYNTATIDLLTYMETTKDWMMQLIKEQENRMKKYSILKEGCKYKLSINPNMWKTTAGHFCWNPFIWLVLTYVTSCTFATNQRKAMSHKHTNKCSQSTTEKTTRSASFLYELMNGRIESRLVRSGKQAGGGNRRREEERERSLFTSKVAACRQFTFFLFFFC